MLMEINESSRSGMGHYHSTFEQNGWAWLDVSITLADQLAQRLHAAGTSFASTAEPGRDRRRFYLSTNSVPVVKNFFTGPHVMVGSIDCEICGEGVQYYDHIDPDPPLVETYPDVDVAVPQVDYYERKP